MSTTFLTLIYIMTPEVIRKMFDQHLECNHDVINETVPYAIKYYMIVATRHSCTDVPMYLYAVWKLFHFFTNLQLFNLIC